MQSRGSYAFLVCGTIVSFMGFGLFVLLLYVRHVHMGSRQGTADTLFIPAYLELLGDLVRKNTVNVRNHIFLFVL